MHKAGLFQIQSKSICPLFHPFLPMYKAEGLYQKESKSLPSFLPLRPTKTSENLKDIKGNELRQCLVIINKGTLYYIRCRPNDISILTLNHLA